MTRTLRFVLIAATLAIATSCGGGGSSTLTSPSNGSSGSNNGTPVTIVSGAQLLTTTAYNPNPLTVSAGTTVTWTNKDSTSHTATGDSGAFTSGTIAPNAQFSFTFANKGTFTYHCSFHPNMVASVVVQ